MKRNRNVSTICDVGKCMSSTYLFSTWRLMQEYIGPHQDAGCVPLAATPPRESCEWFILITKPFRGAPVMNVLKMKHSVDVISTIYNLEPPTFEYIYRRKKSSRKLLPLRNAPATEMTTTVRSRTLSCSSISFSASSFSVNVCSSPPVSTTWTGFAVSAIVSVCPCLLRLPLSIAH